MALSSSEDEAHFLQAKQYDFREKNPYKDSFADKFLTGASDSSPNVREKLDLVGSTVRYEMMKLCTGSVWGGISW